MTDELIGKTNPPLKSTVRILHLEDDRNDVELVQAALRRAGMDADIKVADCREQFFAFLETAQFDVVLSDNKVAGFDGTRALQFVREKRPGTPFIFVSGSADQEAAREKFRLGGAPDGAGKSQLPQLAAAINKVVQVDQASPAPGIESEPYVRGMERLVSVVQELSLARDLDRIMAIVRRAARELTGADGATFVLRDGDLCHYADEDAIAPLWKGRRFPMRT